MALSWRVLRGAWGPEHCRNLAVFARGAFFGIEWPRRNRVTPGKGVDRTNAAHRRAASNTQRRINSTTLAPPYTVARRCAALVRSTPFPGVARLRRGHSMPKNAPRAKTARLRQCSGPHAPGSALPCQRHRQLPCTFLIFQGAVHSPARCRGKL